MQKVVEFKIDWVLTAGTQSDDATLEVQRKIEGSNTWVTIARNLDKDLKDFEVKRLKNNKNYDFRVKSVDPLRGTVYTDLEGIKVEPARFFKNTFKSILNVDQNDNLPVDVSNAIQDLNDAQLIIILLVRLPLKVIYHEMQLQQC